MSRTKLILGINDLGTVNPELAAQWHPDKNGDLTPQKVSAGSNKKVWWQCEKGHEWQASVYDRNKGNGCPHCNHQSRRRLIPGKNDLLSVNPEVASQWHPTKNNDLTPDQVTANSNLLVWWQCANGHEWQALIYNRNKGNGCPHCARRFLKTEKQMLSDEDPVLAAQWHPTKNEGLTPDQISASSKVAVWWRCDVCGNEWQVSVSSRRSHKSGCPSCAKRSRTIEGNDLLTKNPTLAAQWHPEKNEGLSPRCVTPGSNKKVWWQCEKGHEWQASVANRSNGSGCPVCSREQRKSNKRTLLAEKVALDVQKETEKQYKNASDERNDRPIRSQQKSVVTIERSLATEHPELAKEWHPVKNGQLTPEQVAPRSNKKAWWICRNGHEWEAVIASRSQQGARCPVCSNRKLLTGYNDLATINPKLAAQWHPTKNGTLTPKDVFPGTHAKAWWLCEYGHEWEAKIIRRHAGAECPVCANKKRGPRGKF